MSVFNLLAKKQEFSMNIYVWKYNMYSTIQECLHLHIKLETQTMDADLTLSRHT